MRWVPCSRSATDPCARRRAGPTRSGIALVGAGSDDIRTQVAAILARHGATATWFVTGRTLLDDPGAVAAARDRGDEVGVTGFSGRDLAALPAWRVRVELSSTQAVLAAREGITTPLMLLPSSATRATLDRDAVATARSAARQGYSLVVGVEPEAAVGGDVAVIALDRTAPVRLEALLARLASQALRPVRVSEAAGIDPATVNAAVGMPTRFNAVAVTAAVRSAGPRDRRRRPSVRPPRRAHGGVGGRRHGPGGARTPATLGGAEGPASRGPVPSP